MANETTGYARYALYHLPSLDPLAGFVGRWLGWDAASGRETVPLNLPGLPKPQADLTVAPRRYGFHATLKAPFRLAQGQSVQSLSEACADLAGRVHPVILPGLSLTRIGGFLALAPEGATTDLNALAATCVEALDPYRAALSGAEIARRRPDKLTPNQRTMLLDWGYPYVMEEFRFHMTLTDDLPEDQAEQTAAALVPHLGPLLPRPYILSDVCLMGEDADGRFHMVERFALTG